MNVAQINYKEIQSVRSKRDHHKINRF